MATMASNMSFRLTQYLASTVVTSGTFTISNDLERDASVEVTNAEIELINKKGTIRERMVVTCTGGTCTVVLRGLDQTETQTEVASLNKDRDTGTLGYVTILAPSIFDKNATAQTVTANVTWS